MFLPFVNTRLTKTTATMGCGIKMDMPLDVVFKAFSKLLNFKKRK